MEICRHRSCETPISATAFACAKHWKQLTKGIRVHILTAYKWGPPSEWHEGKDRALKHWLDIDKREAECTEST